MSINRFKIMKSIKKSITLIILLLILIVFVMPYFWMVLSSLKSMKEIFTYISPLSYKTFIPIEPTISNYVSIFTKWHFGRYLLNSLFVSSTQMILMVIICSLSAFVFARMKFPGKNILFGFVMFVAFVPFEVVMVPLYLVVSQLGLVDHYAALFLPWIANPFGIFLLRQAMIEIPRDYDESAVIEGANSAQIFWHITLPLVKPSIITLAMMSFLWSWNSFLWPLIVMNDPKKQVVQVAMATFTLPQQLPAWGEIFAGATFATIPVLILFIFMQRYYIRGVVMSGIK